MSNSRKRKNAKKDALPTPDSNKIVAIVGGDGNSQHPPISNSVNEESSKIVVKDSYISDGIEYKKTKQCPSRKKHFFTWNNYPKDGPEQLVKIFNKICVKYVFQEEKGELTGTPHLQGSIILKKSMRDTEFSPKGIWWQATRNEDAADVYCEKAESRNGQIWKMGFPEKLEILKIDQLYPWQKSVVDYVEGPINKRQILWIFEANGAVGKTELAKYLYVEHDALVFTGGACKDIAQILNKEKENGRDLNKKTLICYNISRTKEMLSYQAFEAIKDGLITSTKYEGGMLVFNRPHLIVFANCLPDTEKLSKDRWDIRTIKDNMLVIYVEETDEKHMRG